MKMNTSKKVHYDSGPNMTPLVDVVMVILIFLMLCGTLIGSTWYLRSNMPAASGTIQPDNNTIKTENKVDVQIRMADNGGQVAATINGEPGDFVGVDQLAQAMANKQAQLMQIDPGDNSKMPQFIIRSDPDTPYGVVVQAFEAALKAKIEKVSLGMK